MTVDTNALFVDVATMMYEEHGRELTIDLDRLTAMCVRPSKRAKLGRVIEYNYRYGSIESLVRSVTNYVKGLEASAKAKAERAAAKKAATAEATAATNVGDIFVATWGWEQTNVDAYEIIEKKGATVTLREIALETIEDSEGFMSDRVVPVAGAYIGEAFKKRITNYGIKICDVARATKHEAGKTYYRSWYA